MEKEVVVPFTGANTMGDQTKQSASLRESSKNHQKCEKKGEENQDEKTEEDKEEEKEENGNKAMMTMRKQRKKGVPSPRKKRPRPSKETGNSSPRKAPSSPRRKKRRTTEDDPEEKPKKEEPTLRINWGSSTRIGDRKENQDSFCVPQEGDELRIWGVFDGHGPFGGDAALKAANFLPSTIKEKVQEGSSVEDAVLLAFSLTQDFLLQHGIQQKLECGTTACACVFDNKTRKLTFANAGDSRALLCRYSQVEEGEVKFVTEDHNLNREDERSRLEKSGGTLVFAKNAYRLIPSKEEDQNLPSIVGATNLSLNMSRSFGHQILSRYGVCATPDLTPIDVQPGDRLIIACDGVWDVLANEDVMFMMPLFDTSTQAAKSLVKEAEDRWKRFGRKSDNMTAVVVFF